MSNKHQSNQLSSISLRYMQDELGPFKKCPRQKCGGSMTEVWVRYKDHGYINKELECTMCGKVMKNKPYNKEKPWNKDQQPRYNKHTSKGD